MTLDELKSEVRAILSDEELPTVDWGAVEARCLDINLRLDRDLRSHPEWEVVSHYLDDPAIRKKDRHYAAWQRGQLREWLGKA
jgi:hypothetical protein